MNNNIAIQFANWIAENWTSGSKIGYWDSVELTNTFECKYLIDSTEDLYKLFIICIENEHESFEENYRHFKLKYE